MRLRFSLFLVPFFFLFFFQFSSAKLSKESSDILRNLNSPEVVSETGSEHHVVKRNANSSNGGEHVGVHVVSWNWHHVGVYITITLFVVFSGAAKVGKKIDV